jgi:hypothetical protein
MGRHVTVEDIVANILFELGLVVHIDIVQDSTYEARQM